MNALLRVALCASLSMAVNACGSDDSDDDTTGGNHNTASCSGVTCSGHGTCSLVSGVAVCSCDSGYLPNGTSCTLISATTCDGQTCSGHGTCELSGGNAVCNCDDGYEPFGLSCTATSTGFAGSCELVVGEVTACMEYIGSGYTPTTTEQGCAQAGATYSSGRCTTAGLSGKCTGLAGPSQYVTFYYDIPTEQLATYQTSCTQGGGTWSAS